MESKNMPNQDEAIKVLLIEDDEYVRELYSDAFSLNPGYKLFFIERVKTPEDTLEEIRKINPDVILLDLILPLEPDQGGYVLDKELGFQILEKLKKDKQLSKIPVIVVSNLSGFLEKERALTVGADKYLVKAEIFPQQVISAIEEVLAK